MTIASYTYNDEFLSLMASIKEQRRMDTISISQGNYVGPYTLFSWLIKVSYTKEDVERILNALCDDAEFRKIVLQRHNNNYNDWDSFVIDAIKESYIVQPENYCSWQCLLFRELYDWYVKDTKELYPAYYPNNPLERYYLSKGINLNMPDNYGLIDTNGFELKVGPWPKLYDVRFDTHILIEFVPQKLISFIKEEQSQSAFNLSIRPNYEICGDGIQDSLPILESKVRGEKQPIEIDLMPSLTWLCDDTTSLDRLIILHNKKTREITFEEFLADPQIENDYIVSQVVHLIYTKNKGSISINHLDHEYVFYTSDEHSEKMENLQLKGTARPRYKTFKIDDANIPYRAYCDQNILYRTLDAYFINKNMLKEYFEAMINNRVAGTMNIINRLDI